MKIIATIEADAEKIKALLEHLFANHPDASIHINPDNPTISVKSGPTGAASGTPTNHKPK